MTYQISAYDLTDIFLVFISGFYDHWLIYEQWMIVCIHPRRSGCSHRSVSYHLNVSRFTELYQCAVLKIWIHFNLKWFMTLAAFVFRLLIARKVSTFTSLITGHTDEISNILVIWSLLKFDKPIILVYPNVTNSSIAHQVASIGVCSSSRRQYSCSFLPGYKRLQSVWINF